MTRRHDDSWPDSQGNGGGSERRGRNQEAGGCVGGRNLGLIHRLPSKRCRYEEFHKRAVLRHEGFRRIQDTHHYRHQQGQGTTSVDAEHAEGLGRPGKYLYVQRRMKHCNDGGQMRRMAFFHEGDATEPPGGLTIGLRCPGKRKGPQAPSDRGILVGRRGADSLGVEKQSEIPRKWPEGAVFRSYGPRRDDRREPARPRHGLPSPLPTVDGKASGLAAGGSPLWARNRSNRRISSVPRKRALVRSAGLPRSYGACRIRSGRRARRWRRFPTRRRRVR